MRWSLFQENERWVIRRWKGGKYERLPVHKYRRIRDDEAELIEFVNRLNAPINAKQKVTYKHAFINDALKMDYFRFLKAQIPSEAGARQEYSALERHFLNYFIGKLDLMNPLDWHKVHETQWAEYLLSEEAPEAAKTKRDIVIAANRFMGWLHKQRPAEVPPLEFKPLSKAKLRELEARRELAGKVRERHFIPDVALENIRSKLPEDLAPFFHLGSKYGLRRAETLGCTTAMVRRGYLSIERQYAGGEEYRPLKGRDHRGVPHWFCGPADAHTYIEAALKLRMHPSTLSHRWAEFMKNLGYTYDFHDLRHTFITKALRLHPARDVQLAAGHKDIRTTMGYAHDDRTLDDETYVPNVG